MKKKEKEIAVIPTSLPAGTLFKFDDSDAVYEVKKKPKRLKDDSTYCEHCAFGDYECLMPRLFDCIGDDVYFIEVGGENDCK